MTTMSQTVIQQPANLLDEERMAWLALVLAPGLGPKRILDAVKQLEAREPDFYSAADRAGRAAVSRRGGAVHL